MASIYEGAFDTKALQKELAIALEEDRKYKLTDEMKKRAIHTAASYDEFKNFVLCADLKPVSSKELQNLSRSERRRNLMYHKVNNQTIDGTRTKTLGGKSNKLEPPATSVEFTRTWRRKCLTQETKYKYLQITTPSNLLKLFAGELEADLMMQIITCLNTYFVGLNPNNDIDDFENEQAHVKLTIGMLEAMTKTGRFRLNVSFLDKNQHQEVQQVIQNAEKALLENWEAEESKPWVATVQALKIAFQIP